MRLAALVVAVDLVAEAFVPRPLRGLYQRTVGRRAAEIRELWEDAADAWEIAA